MIPVPVAEVGRDSSIDDPMEFVNEPVPPDIKEDGSTLAGDDNMGTSGTDAPSDAKSARFEPVVEGDLRLCGARWSKERTSWYSYDAAVSLLSGLAFTFVIPLLLAKVAELHSYNSDFAVIPKSCDAQANETWALNCDQERCNLRNDEGNIAQLADSCLGCIRGKGKLLWNVEDAKLIPYVATVPFLGTEINYVSYSTWIISISVFAQALSYIAIGPCMDYGTYRKRILIGTSTAGSIICGLFMAAHGSAAYILLGILAILVNVFYGVGVVAYNSYLPILVDANEKITQVDPNTADESESRAMMEFRVEHLNDMSNMGFIIGYAGQIVGMIAALGIILAVQNMLDDALYYYINYRCGMLFVGLWWFLWTIPAMLWLKPRRSDPLPTRGLGDTLTFGFRSTWKTLKLAWRYKQTIRYFAAYFFFSDMASTIPTVGLLLASEELCMGINELITLAFITPLLAIFGCYLVTWIEHISKGRVSVKSILVTCLMIFSAMSLYGLCGAFTTSFGVHYKWEVYFFSGLMGLLIGPVQSCARQLFSDLIPTGHESSFFSVYEITERGSSFIGPAIVGLVKHKNANIRYAFIYLLAVSFLPALFLWFFVDHKKGAEEVGRLHSRGKSRRRSGIK